MIGNVLSIDATAVALDEISDPSVVVIVYDLPDGVDLLATGTIFANNPANASWISGNAY